MAVLLLAAGTGARFGLRKLQTVATPPQATIYWTVNSAPIGAQIINKQDGTLLGTTPWVTSRAAVPGQLQIIVRAPLHHDEEVSLNQSASQSRTVMLRPQELPPAPPPEVPPPAVPATAEDQPSVGDPAPAGTKQKAGGLGLPKAPGTDPKLPSSQAAGSPGLPKKPPAKRTSGVMTDDDIAILN